MALDLGMTPTGEVEIQVGDRRRRFDNLVLDRGWGSLASRSDGPDGSMVPRWLSFGTGDSDPHPSDSGLEQRMAASEKEATSVAYGGLINATVFDAYSEAVVRFDYAAGELTGDNWTELGLAYGSGYSEPYNRALIRDESRVPVPLVVLSDEPVTVYVRLRLHFNGGWGRVVDLSSHIPGLTGTVNLDNNIGDGDRNIWRKGLPIHSAIMGGTTGTRESLDLSVPSAVFYYKLWPYTDWSATRITFRGRDNTNFIYLDFDPELVKPYLKFLVTRLRITIVRG